ncbi:MAG: 3-oxoadipate enol-lactonase [Pseudomonadota bacterium]
MRIAFADGVGLHYRIDGPDGGAPIVFGNSLGTDLRVWDPLLARLPGTLRILRYDKRGHGLSDCPPAPYSMGVLISDAEKLIEDAGFGGAVFVGLSIGGMIAQGLAVKRPDLLRAMVLSNTAAKIGTAEMWGTRIEAARAGGLDALVDGTMERWFSSRFQGTSEVAIWRNMFTRQPADGWIGCAAAISGSDFFSTTAGLTLPTLAIAGSEDGSTPPDLVRETADLISGARLHLIRGAGHIPCVEAPDEYAEVLMGFLEEIGHV